MINRLVSLNSFSCTTLSYWLSPMHTHIHTHTCVRVRGGGPGPQPALLDSVCSGEYNYGITQMAGDGFQRHFQRIHVLKGAAKEQD